MRRFAILMLGMAFGMASWDAGVELWWASTDRQEMQQQTMVPNPDDGVRTAEDGTPVPPK
jgi:hypothetical protein